ncbi:MAG: hypothetical protein KDD34_08365, partial [Bdellovibrionales bacterium]|nr:hypothetical protein [Bdellovibrionales bacterium]
MKFLFSRDLRELPHIRLSLIFYMISIFIFWGLNWPYEATTFGLFPKDIQMHLLGNPDLFAAPMEVSALLLNIHIRLFLYT